MTPTSQSVVPSDGRYQPGDLIHDKYQLVRRLGQGGMGTVWVAQNTVLQVSVAVKLIELAKEQDTDETAERLLREARAAARLDHPAIVRVFDFGRTKNGDPFIVMELLHGESLADILNRDSRMTAVQAARAMLPIAEALSSAHDKGVVHRDVKPENVILATSEDGKTQPKLLDFGIASLQEKSARITQEKRLTREGSVVGTPAYMSPEQAMGKADLDQRTDVWSFGVMLYELVTGRLPFDADNYNALLYEIINEQADPVTTHAAGDEELWQILEVALRKKPEERWGSMRAFGEALALWLVDRGVTDDICAASLRGNWLEFSAEESDKVDLARTVPGVPSSGPRSRPLVPPPAPARPPRITPTPSSTPRKARWPLRLAFLASCFVAGLLLVRHLVADSAPPPRAEAKAGAHAGPQALATDSAVNFRADAENDENDSAARAPVHAVPLDEVLGEAEAVGQDSNQSSQALAAKKRRPPSPSKKPAKSHKQIDFGF